MLVLAVKVTAQKSGDVKALAKPSNVQFEWHEQERIMFIHFGIATWLGQEYDEQGNFDLKRINPTNLNTDEWCETAKLWGAKEIIFVAKHVGGFCWWPTRTTEYCVRNIPWKNGKGDLLKEISTSCKKAGLNLGVYIYPGDVSFGAGIGSGGKTADPSLQTEYNKVYRQQLLEVLANYGQMMEVWFDGNCVIDVNDILEKYAKKSVIFQSKQASIRWPGTESGKLSYPAWNTVSSEKLITGLTTQYDDDPNGDAWAPLESNLPLYNHNWFWNPTNESKRRSLDELMEVYYKSVGYGSVMLLNSTPDTTGKIPYGDRLIYKKLGDEINRRFNKAEDSILNKLGSVVQVNLKKPTPINHIVWGEDYRMGHRIRAYQLAGKINGQWKTLIEGTSVGRKKIDPFETTEVTAVKLTITKFAATPSIKYLKLYNVKNYELPVSQKEMAQWTNCGNWDTKTFENGRDTIDVDLSFYIQQPGQYEVKFLQDVVVTGANVKDAIIEIDHQNTLQTYLIRKGNDLFYINRTAQISINSATKIRFIVESDNQSFQNRGRFVIRKRVINE